ncbi:MAG: hypothetical protein ABFS34_15365 [Gemmatimonadota bacterium]
MRRAAAVIGIAFVVGGCYMGEGGITGLGTGSGNCCVTGGGGSDGGGGGGGAEEALVALSEGTYDVRFHDRVGSMTVSTPSAELDLAFDVRGFELSSAGFNGLDYEVLLVPTTDPRGLSYRLLVADSIAPGRDNFCVKAEIVDGHDVWCQITPGVGV